MSAPPLEFEQPIVELEQKLQALRHDSNAHSLNADSEVTSLEEKLEKMRRQIYANLSPWQRVQIARHIERPFMLDYVELCFSDFVELKGDRLYGDDAAMPAGLAKLGEHRVAVVGHQKGRNTKENVVRNFGSPHPEGYRKALRLMKLAEKFQLPVICLIDTPGAYPGIGAESRHISESIAVNLREMMVLRTPVISVIIGEGGSGGALGIGVADTVAILENAYYSVISPEGCAAILWKDRKFKAEAADAMHLTAAQLKELGLIDKVLPEPLGGAHKDWEDSCKTLRDFLMGEIDLLKKEKTDRLLAKRYEKFRAYGAFLEPG